MTPWKTTRHELIEAAEAGDGVAVRLAMSSLVAGEESPRVFTLGVQLSQVAALAASASLVSRRGLVLRSYTIEPMMAALVSHALARGLRLEVEVADYGQFELRLFAEGIDEAPDFVILATLPEDLDPGLGPSFTSLAEAEAHTMIEAAAARALSWLTAARSKFPSASIILAGVAQPVEPTYGLADAGLALGHRRAIELVNEHLRAACRSHSGAIFFDVDAVLSLVGRQRSRDPRMWAHAKQPYAAEALARLAERLSRVLAARYTPRRKCVVLDCDNTLWGGIVGEDGLAGISLGTEHPGSAFVAFQRALLALHHRGVLLALASKNNEADVLEVLDSHRHQVIRREHVAAQSIGWGDKASALEAIAKQLNIGLDSLIFIDDSDYECALVRARLPMVEVVQTPSNPLELAPMVAKLESLDAILISADDRARGAMYKAQAARSEAKDQASSLDGFLHSLELVIEISAPRAGAEIERAAQLCQRTNQLNATTRRHQVADLEQMIADPSVAVRMVRLSDRFGDYGICGLAIIRFEGDAGAIDTFLLSCRVLGRGVEAALGSDLEDVASARAANRIDAQFVETAKNAPAAKLFDSLGYRVLDRADGVVRYQKSLSGPRSPVPAWFKVA